jgi:hypothetical protein
MTPNVQAPRAFRSSRSRSFPQIFCALCSKPVDLNIDLSTDENGKSVHDNCYFNHIAKRKHAESCKNLMMRWRNSRFGLEGLRE